jgi:hypothetical protein
MRRFWRLGTDSAIETSPSPAPSEPTSSARDRGCTAVSLVRCELRERTKKGGSTMQGENDIAETALGVVERTAQR